MKENTFARRYGLMILAGGVVGAAALILTAAGNPKNMGFCIACFERDIAGALGLHGAGKVQYLRPEIPGIVLGAMLSALSFREFKARAGSCPASRFVLGLFVMIGALAFLGCPLRMVIRLGGGDLTAVAGLLGFLAGILVGVAFLKKGFSLGRAYPVKRGEGLISLAAGLAVGFFAQRSRLCMAGGLRDVFLLRDFTLLAGFLAIWATVTVGNLILGNYNLSMLSQPVAHSQHLWSFLGMALAGWGSILLGGCPLRQLILAGEGSGDAAVTVLGMVAGAAAAHNFGLAGNPDSAADGVYQVGGIGTAGMIAVVIGFAVLLAVSLLHLPGKEEA